MSNDNSDNNEPRASKVPEWGQVYWTSARFSHEYKIHVLHELGKRQAADVLWGLDSMGRQYIQVGPRIDDIFAYNLDLGRELMGEFPGLSERGPRDQDLALFMYRMPFRKQHSVNAARGIVETHPGTDGADFAQGIELIDGGHYVRDTNVKLFPRRTLLRMDKNNATTGMLVAKISMPPREQEEPLFQ